MKITKMKLANLKTPDKNVRIHTEKQLKEFERSVKMFGQIRPIVIDEDNVILAGNGLAETLRNMGIEQADVYKITNLGENQKKKLMIADNKIFSLGIENLGTLNEFLEELGTDLDIPGFDEEILKAMVADAEEVTERISGYGTLSDEEIVTIRDTPDAAAGNTGNESADETDSLELDAAVGDGDHGELRKSVICPECGKCVWL